MIGPKDYTYLTVSVFNLGSDFHVARQGPGSAHAQIIATATHETHAIEIARALTVVAEADRSSGDDRGPTADFVMELHCHLSDALDDAAKKAVVEATGFAARDYMRSVAGGDVRSVNLRGTSPEESAAMLPVALIERAAVIAEEYGWGGLAAELRDRSASLSHERGPFWHEHRFDSQVLRHAHAGDSDHGYFDHPEDL